MKENSWEEACPKCGYLTCFGPPPFTVTYIKHTLTDEERLSLACRRCGYTYVIPCLDAEKKEKP